jgi:hypothetical protein
MGPPPRSFAADAHDCIMVRSLWAYRIQGCGAMIRAPMGKLPSDRPSRSRQACRRAQPSRCGLARPEHAERLVRRPTLDGSCARRRKQSAGRDEETAMRSNKETNQEKRCVMLPTLLDKNHPIQGLSANDVASALISMMVRSNNELQSETGYIDARPLQPDRRNLLAPHGRTIHWVMSGPAALAHWTSV